MKINADVISGLFVENFRHWGIMSQIKKLILGQGRSSQKGYPIAMFKIRFSRLQAELPKSISSNTQRSFSSR